MAGDLIRFGSLWKNKDRQGNAYLSGSVQTQQSFEDAIRALRDGGRLMIFSNTKKREGKKDPDCILYVAPPRESQRNQRTKRDPNAPSPENDMEPDWNRRCSTCGDRPVVPATGLCGPCTFGEADTAGGNW